MARTKTGKRTGVPYSLHADAATLKTLAGLGQIMCTTKEASAFLQVSEPTFLSFLKREPIAHETFWRAHETGRISLRRTQIRLAQTSAAMAIWLGKQLLGQTDPDRRYWQPIADDTPPAAPAPIRMVAVYPGAAEDQALEGEVVSRGPDGQAAGGDEGK